MTIYNVLVVDDNDAHRNLYASTIKSEQISVTTACSPAKALAQMDRGNFHMIISDMRMPGMDGISFLKKVRQLGFEMPFLLVTAFPAIKDAVSALKLGAVDYLEKPVDLAEMRIVVNDTLQVSDDENEPELPKECLEGIVTENSYMKQLIKQCYQVAKSDVTTLLTGESGTGKEVFAQFIHRNSLRSAKPFIAVNCASIPQNLLASELFGHVKGAFTGALNNRLGRFREADHGTLFLDEIGDMPLELQPTLLRVLEVGKIVPVGLDLEERVDVRIIAATNKDLEQCVKDGTFREDLYYRLNVISFELPKLSDRPDDIIPLARYFLKQGGASKRLSPLATTALTTYNWPGNIRELSNAMERAKVLATGDIILPEHLPPTLRRSSMSATNMITEQKTMEDAERIAIIQALQANNGNRTHASEQLGISRRSLIYKIKRYGL